MKEVVRQYWDNEPCGTRDIPYPVGSLDYFEAIAERRDRLDWFIPEYAQFDKWKGKKVLEVGCGAGSDSIRFAQAGADITSIDLSPRSVLLTRERLHLYGCKGNVLEADAEEMPFDNDNFDFAYSYGVLHHTPNIYRAINEIYRVLKSGGQICIMLYHKYSLVALQMWLMFGLFKLKPTRSISDILANHHESLGTKAYTVNEVERLFSSFDNVKIHTRVTAYDIRYSRNGYLPIGVAKLIPQCLGWNIIIQGQKP